jgi:hypothetical protein
MTDDAPAPEEELEEYVSGPYCRHWSDPSDCEIKCENCGHLCGEHGRGGHDPDCDVDGCNCKEWKD